MKSSKVMLVVLAIFGYVFSLTLIVGIAIMSLDGSSNPANALKLLLVLAVINITCYTISFEFSWGNKDNEKH